MELLARNFNVETLEHVMCRNLVSVNYDGLLYDCDFNQQLALEMMASEEYGTEGREVGTETAGSPVVKRLTVFDVENLDELKGRAIRTENHCYGCTAGRGSS